ncbi:MAG: hypothetical protein HPZ91_16095 [Lentisphaeria bacterium]|nr:hypothetical protein [Lentisphaeria bacterium]
MADWQEFIALYSANFGRMTENDGPKEWLKFVEQEVKNMAVLRAALQPHIDRYAAALDNMEPAKRPTLGQVRRSYYAELDRIRQEREMRRFGAGTVCGVCFGPGVLFVLAPLAGDAERIRWPEDFRERAWREFRGVELAKCPACSGRFRPELGRRIESNGLPLSIRPEHPDWPAQVDDYCRRNNRPPLAAMGGDQAIVARMKRNEGPAK